MRKISLKKNGEEIYNCETECSLLDATLQLVEQLMANEVGTLFEVPKESGTRKEKYSFSSYYMDDHRKKDDYLVEKGD